LYGSTQQPQQPQRTIVSTRTGGAIPPPAQVVQNVPQANIGVSQYAVTTAPGTVAASSVQWIPGEWTPQIIKEGMNIQDIRNYIRSLNPNSKVGRTLDEAATIMANFLNSNPTLVNTHPFTFTRARAGSTRTAGRQQSQYVIPQNIPQGNAPLGVAGNIQQNIAGNIQQNIGGNAPLGVAGNIQRPFATTTQANIPYRPVNVQPLPTAQVTTTPQRNQLPVAYTTAQRNEPEDVKDLRIALLQAGQARLKQLYRSLTGTNVRVGVANAAIVDELITFYNNGQVTAQQLLQGATANVTPNRRSNRLGTGQLTPQQNILPEVLPYYNALQNTPVDQIIALMRVNVPPYITDEQGRLSYVRDNINDYVNVVRSAGRTQPVTKQQLMGIPNPEQFLDTFTDIELIGMSQAVVPYESRRELVSSTAALTREPGAFIPTTRDCRNTPSNGIDLNDPNTVNVIAVGLLDSYDCYTVQELARGVTRDQMGDVIIMLDNGTLITSSNIMTDIHRLSQMYPQLRPIYDAIELARSGQQQTQSTLPMQL
jgi:hypothetical protein